MEEPFGVHRRPEDGLIPAHPSVLPQCLVLLETWFCVWGNQLEGRTTKQWHGQNTSKSSAGKVREEGEKNKKGKRREEP